MMERWAGLLTITGVLGDGPEAMAAASRFR